MTWQFALSLAINVAPLVVGLSIAAWLVRRYRLYPTLLSRLSGLVLGALLHWLSLSYLAGELALLLAGLVATGVAYGFVRPDAALREMGKQ
jgi:hypothetical protein